MSDNTKTADAPTKKKGGFLKIAMLGIVLLSAGGGGTYAAFATGLLGEGEAGHTDDTPQLVLKGEADPYPIAAGTDTGEQVEIVHGTGGSKYRTAYYSFGEEFTSNLADSTALVQLSLAASTQRDGRVLMWLADHELALRSRILVELAATDEAELISPGGKEKLQQRLTQAINQVLEEREGFGGVDNVYFRSFIIQ